MPFVDPRSVTDTLGPPAKHHGIHSSYIISMSCSDTAAHCQRGGRHAHGWPLTYPQQCMLAGDGGDWDHNVCRLLAAHLKYPVLQLHLTRQRDRLFQMAGVAIACAAWAACVLMWGTHAGLKACILHLARSNSIDIPIGTSTSFACTATGPRASRSRVPAPMPCQISARDIQFDIAMINGNNTHSASSFPEYIFTKLANPEGDSCIDTTCRCLDLGHVSPMTVQQALVHSANCP